MLRRAACVGRNCGASSQGFPAHFGSKESTEISVAFLQQATVCSYENSCPLRTTGGKRTVPWWSPQLVRLHWETRRLLNKARSTGMPSNLDPSRRLKWGTKVLLGILRERVEGRSVWESVTFWLREDSIKSLPKIPWLGFGPLLLPSGEYASSWEALKLMLGKVHIHVLLCEAVVLYKMRLNIKVVDEKEPVLWTRYNNI
jgi:hypothetical protein